MMTIDLTSFINFVVNNGVAIGVLAWFMFRMEKKIEEMTKAINDLVKVFSMVNTNNNK
jgi:hypothetical protein